MGVHVKSLGLPNFLSARPCDPLFPSRINQVPFLEELFSTIIVLLLHGTLEHP